MIHQSTASLCASKAYQSILLLAAALILATTNATEARSGEPAAADFFAFAPTNEESLPADGIYPQGRKFGFGLYAIAGQNQFDPSKSNMQRVAQQGFTLAGPYYNRQWQGLEFIHEAAANGLDFTYQIRPHEKIFGTSIGGTFHDDRLPVLESLTDAEIAASVRHQLETVLADPVANATVARWSLGAEELRHWKGAEMNYLRVTRETIRQVETEHGLAHRPFWMYEPGNRTIDELRKTGAYQDMVSKGHYLTTKFERGDQRAGWSMWSLDQIVGAADRLGTVPQAVFQLWEDFSDPLTGNDPDEIRRVIRHDAYLGLVKGIESMNVLSMFEHRQNLTTHNEQFEAYGSVALDLTGPQNLQRVFLFGEEMNDLEVSVTEGQESILFEPDDDDLHVYSALNFLNAAVDGERYLVLVNSSEKDMTVSVDGLPADFGLQQLFEDGALTQVEGAHLSVTLPALGVEALRLTQLPQFSLGQSLFGPATSAIPEPASILLFLLALGGLGRVRR